MTDDHPVPTRIESPPAYLSWRFWVGSLLSLAALFALGWWIWNVLQTTPVLPGFGSTSQNTPGPGSATLPGATSALPPPLALSAFSGLHRQVDPHTVIPTRGPSWITYYTVERGDTLGSIALKFKLNWESILWGNTDTLEDDPNYLKPGQVLNILPVDGMFYQWKQGDTVENIALEYNTTAEAILDWPGNDLNPFTPNIEPGAWVIIPGGMRPFLWEAPMVIKGKSATFALGAGACPGSYNGTPGSEPWGWPTAGHELSGYDFGAGHSGIDIAIYMGQPIYSAQAGVVVYAGPVDESKGYGILVIIDHLNGWHTFYAHLSGWNVGCGQQVYAGTLLGYGGSTGRSTGPHLHFEMRYKGIPQNPWGLLP